MFFKTLTVGVMLSFSIKIFAVPVVLVPIIEIYVQYAKMCPQGFVSIKEKDRPASPSIAWNKAHSIYQLEHKDDPVEKQYCIPSISNANETSKVIFTEITKSFLSRFNAKPTIIYSDTYKRNHHMDQYKENDE